LFPSAKASHITNPCASQTVLSRSASYENRKLLEAAQALLEGKRVMAVYSGQAPFEWDGRGWNRSWNAFIAPEPKKMRKVKMLAWFDSFDELRWKKGDVQVPLNWERVPAEDKEIEVEDV
jgi:hypothetical protein